MNGSLLSGLVVVVEVSMSATGTPTDAPTTAMAATAMTILANGVLMRVPRPPLEKRDEMRWYEESVRKMYLATLDDTCGRVSGLTLIEDGGDACCRYG